MLKVAVPILTALIGAGGAFWISESAVFSKYSVDVQKMILQTRMEAYLDYMAQPTHRGRYRLILLGNSNVIKAMGDIYTKHCKDRPEGKCEDTCEANKAYAKLYRAMRDDFQLTSTDTVSEKDIYKAQYEKEPDCS